MSCTPNWYGDQTSFMGNGRSLQLPNALKYKVGFAGVVARNGQAVAQPRMLWLQAPVGVSAAAAICSCCSSAQQGLLCLKAEGC